MRSKSGEVTTPGILPESSTTGAPRMSLLAATPGRRITMWAHLVARFGAQIANVLP